MVEMKLKRKYHAYPEPRKWLNDAGHRNIAGGRGKASGNIGVARGKHVVRPRGALSGRSGTPSGH